MTQSNYLLILMRHFIHRFQSLLQFVFFLVPQSLFVNLRVYAQVPNRISSHSYIIPTLNSLCSFCNDQNQQQHYSRFVRVWPNSTKLSLG